MARCLISLGANIGQSAETIAHAANLLQSQLAAGLRRFELSRLYRTPAVGGPRGQPPFINAVAALEIDGLSPWDVWHVVRDIEHALGRVRMERWEARRIDLDVLLFEDQRIWTQHFKLPHPRMVMRRFILEPALDVAAQWREPVSGLAIAELAERLRSGPASIALVASNLHRGQALLERAAAQSGSQWLTPSIAAQARHLPTDEGACERQLEPAGHAAGRWLGLVSAQKLAEWKQSQALLQPAPKLVFLLAEPLTVVGAAWEDVHRDLADWLGLTTGAEAHGEDRATSGSSVDPKWPLGGPRYLLATDDPRWAEHEIVSAMEAMDCPVEVASNSS